MKLLSTLKTCTLFFATGIGVLLYYSAASAQEQGTPQLPFEITGIYTISDIPEISGIAFLKKSHGTLGDTAHCLVVSDKVQALYSVQIPLAAAPSGKEVPLKTTLVRTIPKGVDLEGIAITPDAKAAWLCGENFGLTNSKVYHVPFDSKMPVRSFSLKEILNGQGNGAEGIALVPVGNTLELWVAHERLIPASVTPPIYRYTLAAGDTPVYKGKFTLSMQFHRSQSDLCYDPLRKRLWVLSRELRALFAIVPAEAIADKPKPDNASFNFSLWEQQINIHTTYGMAEGITADRDGLLYLCFDNNGVRIGTEPKHLTRDSRIIVAKPR